jgi:prepilin-type N-terminal cleavage/methylation domain-containing protein
MYAKNTPKTYFEQAKKPRTSGFTLVEIMIVILIIVMLTQLWNVWGLFRNRERSKVEEIAVKIVGTIDEEKINALLWKTKDGKIVRKRLTEIVLKNTENAIEISSEVNLAETDENAYDATSKKTTSWTLPGLETFVYECPTNNIALTISDLSIEFINENIIFKSSGVASVPNHVVLLLTHINTSHEIHIDRRTGLTYEIDGVWKDTNGDWQITCN